MSIFGKMIRRADGKELRTEDSDELYYLGDGSKRLVYELNHLDMNAAIYTDGRCPEVRIRVKGIPLSSFAGLGSVKINDIKGNTRTAKRICLNGTQEYIIVFDKDSDFVMGEHDGEKQTSVSIEKNTYAFIRMINRIELNDNKIIFHIF